MSDYEGSGTVHMSALGPHFYVDVDEGEKPPWIVDTVTDTMNQFLTELDADHGWPIKHEHIKAGPPITRVEWEPDEDDVNGYDISVEMPSVSLSWYSKKKLRDYDYI